MKTETGMQCQTYHSTGIVCSGCEKCATAEAQSVALADASCLSLEEALDAEYPIPNSPHGSIMTDAYRNRSAFQRGWVAAFVNSPAPTPAAPQEVEQARDAGHLPGWERGIATVTMNGHQLREALEFINPDGDDDIEQRDNDLTFGIVQHKDDDGKVSTGLCCWNDDTDGVLPLDNAAMSAQPDDSGSQG